MVGGDKDAYDTRLGLGVTVQAIHQLQAFGIEPDVWKVEGRTGARTMSTSSRRGAAMAATALTLSCSDAAKTLPRSGPGLRQRPPCRGSSGSLSAEPRSGMR